jgi:hypothetical protein
MSEFTEARIQEGYPTIVEETKPTLSPLRDGCFFVDNSMLELIQTCPWLAYASIVRHKRPATESSALRFGGFIHKALEFRNRATALGQPWTEHQQIEMLSTLFAASPLETEGWRNLASAVLAIRGYNAHYFKDDYTVAQNAKGEPYVEQPFAVDTHRVVRGWRVIYIGRIDLKKVLPNGFQIIVDHKTSSMLGDSAWADWEVSAQFRGYCWADRECTGVEPSGYEVDAIGAKESIANAMFDEVLGKVVPTSAKSKAVPLELARQTTFTSVPPGQLDEWFENMLQQVDHFLYNLERHGDRAESWPRHRYNHCVGKYGKCQFYNVCSLPIGSRADALESTAYVENTWSPLYS